MSKKERTPYWHALKKETDEMIKKSKKNFYEEVKSNAKERGDPSLYYRAVTKLKDAEKSQSLIYVQCSLKRLTSKLEIVYLHFLTKLRTTIPPLVIVAKRHPIPNHLMYMLLPPLYVVLKNQKAWLDVMFSPICLPNMLMYLGFR